MGGGTPRRWAGRICFAGALVALAAPIVAPASAQEEVVRPDVFRASTTARVASVQADREALLPVPEAFRFVALDGEGSYESSNQTASASILYPGNGVLLGPDLLCGTFGAQFPDELAPVLEACQQLEYPLTVFADSLHPEASTDGSIAVGDRGDPVSARSVSAEARAGLDATTSDAAIADLRVLGLPALGPIEVPLPLPGLPELDTSLLSIDTAASRTDQRITDEQVLVAEAEATVAGIRLIGGLVEIGSLSSRSVVTDDGRGEQTHDAELDLGGISVAGLPARITDEGLVLGSPTGLLAPLRQQLGRIVDQLLDGLGIHITLLEVDEGVDDRGLAFARAGGLLIEFALDVGGLPTIPGPLGDIDPNGIYVGTIQVGATGANGTASFIDDPPVDPAEVASPRPAPSGGGPAPPPATSPATQPTRAAEGPTATVAAPEDPPEEVGFVDDLFAERLAFLYLSFTLAALGLCLAPGVGLPARLPRSDL